MLFEKTGERTVNLSNVDVGPRYSFLGIYSSRIKELETKETHLWDLLDESCR